MLNDVKPPPMDDDPSPKHPMHLKPHVDLREPGKHHSRVMGEATHTDPIYLMPMEDRGSGFSLLLSVVVIVVVVAVLVSVYVAMS